MDDVEEAVGAHLSVHMPSSRDVPVSVNKGLPITFDQPDHPVSEAMRKLADRCAGTTSVRETKRRMFSLGRKK